MNMRRELLREVLAVVDSQINVVRDKQSYLRSHRDANDLPQWRRARKRNDLRLERHHLTRVRFAISMLRYRPLAMLQTRLPGFPAPSGL